ncbi:MAG: acylneuraminate cytidylyltransferase family protein [Candidatus Woesearchaeota archaeon]|nr:acylneuraminate cytidylyltransferase family protein [Candidatus Woesearchaeota archaeon]
MHFKILAIIPARGGSKRIPGKNIKLLAGKPLIAYSIEAAKKSKLVNRIIVSTDDAQIAEVSKKYGSEIIERPANLAQDYTPTLPVMTHVLDVLEEREQYKPDFIILLQPTCPLRNEEDINNVIKLMADGADSAQTFCKTVQHPAYMATIKNGTATPIDKKGYATRSQDLPEIYAKNGAVYGVTYGLLMNKKTLYGKNNRAAIMPIERSVEIDELSEFKLAEFYLKEK